MPSNIPHPVTTSNQAGRFRTTFPRWYLAVIFTLTCIALAVWCLPHVPAIRYLSLLALAILLLPVLLINGRSLTASPLSWLAILWILYLAIWPFFAPQEAAAHQAWQDQWGKFSLTLLAGGGVGWILANLSGVSRQRLLLGMAWSALTPCILHLGIILGVWLGLIPLTNTGWLNGGWAAPPPEALQQGAFGTLAAFPWGDWGIQVHHAELGYASLTALIFAGAAAFNDHSGRIRWVNLLAILCIAASSCLIAYSRASLLFLGLSFIAILLLQMGIRKIRLRSILVVGLLLLLSAGTLAWVAYKTDVRWQQTFQAFGAAIQIHDPGYVCLASAGVQPEGQERVDVSTFSRVLFLTLGVQELTQHPFGYDGSRSSFAQLVSQYCPPGYPPPAHTHNGWLDMGISIGIPGVILWLILLVAGLRMGWQQRMTPAGRGLWLCAFVLISRALVDSVFRDHMMEMWSFVFMLFGAMLIAHNSAYATEQATPAKR